MHCEVSGVRWDFGNFLEGVSLGEWSSMLDSFVVVTSEGIGVPGVERHTIYMYSNMTMI